MKIRKELEFWEPFLKRAVDEGQLVVGWKTIPRMSPQMFDIDNLRALRIIGCGLTGQCRLSCRTPTRGGRRRVHVDPCPPPDFPDAFSTRHSSLRSLFLPSNKLTTLPPSVRFLTNVTELNIMDNRITELPEEVTLMTAITDLQVTRNRFTRLPEHIGRLDKMPRMNFDCNHLTSLPHSLTKAHIRRLNLNYNHLAKLPAWFGHMGHLTQLFLNRNKLMSIPVVLADIPSLTHLSLAHNNISEFPKEFPRFTNLKTLWLDWNQITRLPLVFQSLTRLESLKLEGNPLRRPRMQFLVEEGVKGLSEWCAKEAVVNDQKRDRGASRPCVAVAVHLPEFTPSRCCLRSVACGLWLVLDSHCRAVHGSAQRRALGGLGSPGHF